MNWSEVFGNAITGIVIFLLGVMFYRVPGVLKAAVEWFRSRSEFQKAQTEDFHVKDATRTAVLHTKQTYVDIVKKTDQWKVAETHNHARDMAFKTAHDLLATHHITISYIDLTTRLEAEIAAIKAEEAKTGEKPSGEGSAK